MTRPLDAEYGALLDDLKDRVQQARLRAATGVNRELVLLYWRIGHEILARQAASGWGSKVVDRLSRDLLAAFPDMRGLSSRNLKYMRAFAEAWPDEEFVQQAAARIPWFHNVAIVEQVKDPEQRRFYVDAAIRHGWSRSVLVLQIGQRLHEREGRAITNFAATLPPPQSDLAQQITRDPYCFDFLSLGPGMKERELERGLVHHIRDFLIELGIGFAFVGSQVPLRVAEQEYFLDLLFYHLHLRCFVVLELKAGPFEPEHAGKLNFYLSAVDDLLRHPSDQPTIGMLLCRTRHDLVVEYALRDLAKPIGVANWQTRLVDSLPTDLEGRLPTVEELEAELAGHTDPDGEPQ